MRYEFSAYGHPNISGKHKTTIEFTKDKKLNVEGDCIIGVNSDFSLESIKEFINTKKSMNEKSMKIIIIIKEKKWEVNAELNPDFDDDKEIVIRKSDFISKRTLGVNADKGAVDLGFGKLGKEDRIVVTLE
jgi:hypothetical protein